MEGIVISALLFSAIIYLSIGFVLSKRNKTLVDLFPIIFGRTAKVQSVDEFSTSAVATTVSLATIVLAYFELSGYFGVWLLWTALTTTIGMVLVSVSSKKIWNKMAIYDHRPSMHEFIGTEFNSKSVALIASACTSIGFLLIFATEIVVGSLFLAGLVPSIPEWATVIFLTLVGLTYTLYGGFRAVIKTDQIQMKFIWAFIFVLAGYYIYHIVSNEGVQFYLSKIPNGILNFSYREGLLYFLIGLTIMNIPTHISNMSIWQRISGVQNPDVLEKGLRKSVWGLIFSWSLLSLLACFAYMFVNPPNSQTLFFDLLSFISRTFLGKIVLFVVVIGLYGAMLSTASTNLIAIAHTISEDIIAKIRKGKLEERIDSKNEFLISRLILIGATILALFLVEGLKLFGFSIADLVFAIYGGALALFPLIIVAIFSNRERLSSLSFFANIAVIAGFFSGWTVAIIGKIISNGNLIFLSPTFSIFISGVCLCIGFLATRKSSMNILQK